MKNIEDIREQVESRLVARRAEFEVARTRERRIVAIALAAFAIAAAATLLSLDGLLGLHWSWTPLVALILMIFMVVWREGATQRARRLQFAVDWLERWCDRLDDRWEFSRDPGTEYTDAAHPYASDLDVFGEGSVFERLNATYTVLGRDDLAGLLTDQAPAGTAEERQVAVRELRDAWNERELFEVELRSLGEHTDEGSEASTRLDRDTRALLDWGASKTAPPEPAAVAWLHTLLGVTATFTIVAHFALGWSWGPFIAHYLLNLVVLGRARDIDGLLEKFEKVRETLDAWSRCLVHMERYEPEAALLKKVREPLLSGSLTASLAIKKLKSLADRLSWKRNKFWAATFDVLWLWDLHARRSLLLWKRTHGMELQDWLKSAGRMEAMLSLAGYAAAVPESCFPEIDPDGPFLAATSLQHPLLPRTSRVGNDMESADPGSLLLVTGSNMSGKSTFLRTVGLTAVMARMGLPVTAERVSMQNLRITTCMRVHDSIQSGSSQFHAEVTRLALCVKWASAEEPTLVLLDEILAGTNSRERHVGTLCVMRSLAKLNTRTLVATHDLTLVELEQEFPTALRTVHFRDLITDDLMSFDYVMREGPLPSTNALRVMRAAGLDVPEEAG